MSILKYRGYEGSAEFDAEKLVCCGKLLFIDDLVTYESDSAPGLKKEFEAAVDDYIETCELVGKEPSKTRKGVFNVRVRPELHCDLAREAVRRNWKLNELVVRLLEDGLRKDQGEARTLGNLQKYAGVVALGLAERKLITIGTGTLHASVFDLAECSVSMPRKIYANLTGAVSYASKYTEDSQYQVRGIAASSSSIQLESDYESRATAH